MQIVQVELRKEHPEGTYTACIVWLPVEKRLKIGMVITLKGDSSSTKWNVHKLFKETIDIEEIKRGWNNNI